MVGASVDAKSTYVKGIIAQFGDSRADCAVTSGRWPLATPRPVQAGWPASATVSDAPYPVCRRAGARPLGLPSASPPDHVTEAVLGSPLRDPVRVLPRRSPGRAAATASPLDRHLRVRAFMAFRRSN
jgi:hypothetical protein